MRNLQKRKVAETLQCPFYPWIQHVHLLPRILQYPNSFPERQQKTGGDTRDFYYLSLFYQTRIKSAYLAAALLRKTQCQHRETKQNETSTKSWGKQWWCDQQKQELCWCSGFSRIGSVEGRLHHGSQGNPESRQATLKAMQSVWITTEEVSEQGHLQQIPRSS